MEFYRRSDGARLAVVDGFRRAAKGYRQAVTPRADWDDAHYAASADKKLRRFGDVLEEVRRFRPAGLDGAALLEVGCGDAIHCLLAALHPVRRVVGIDLHLPLREPSARGAQVRRLAEGVLARAGERGGVDGVLGGRPIELATMDARALGFPDSAFDLLLSRSAMEHIVPIDVALAEMIRVVRPGGLIHHSVDPFFWLRGCHKRGVTDIPWAHARLSDADFERFVREKENAEKAAKRLQRIQTLNRYPLRRWRELLQVGVVEVLEYREEVNDWSAAALRQYPDVVETLLPGVEERDLVVGRINAWLRKR